MGETAERVAAKYEVDRQSQDEFALRSHQRAVAAQGSGRFDVEIVPVTVPRRREDPLVLTSDEGPRPDSSLESLARLRPAFQKDGTVTAGNASPLNDGAAALVLMSAEQARDRGLQPLARLVAGAAAGVHPDYMGIGPVPATLRAPDPARPQVSDLGLGELSEAVVAHAVAG